MRELKFRAFDNGQMVLQTNTILTNEMDQLSWFFKAIRRDSIVMQFIGLKDKNGKEIYESDIVRILYTDWSSKSDSDPRTLEQYLIDISHVGQVVFNDNSWEVKKHSIKYNDFIFSSINHGKYGFIEVIGNIYENPELMKLSTVGTLIKCVK